jgi:hypothetical protein
MTDLEKLRIEYLSLQEIIIISLLFHAERNERNKWMGLYHALGFGPSKLVVDLRSMLAIIKRQQRDC